MRRFQHPPRPTYVDLLWQTVFRLGFPVARTWWRIWRSRHQGALVAVHVDHSLLLLRSSYRSAWNFPGGSVRRAEAPETAARRELAEEIGISPDGVLHPAGEACGIWDGRRDRVFFFALHLDQLPRLRLDNREIVGARLVPLRDLRAMRLTEPVRAYVNGWLPAAAFRGDAE
jgi:8-oxo-dGTP pyrophosphatase MutT (NUDIX family)